MTDGSDRIEAVKKTTVTTTRVITAELRVTETIERVEQLPSLSRNRPAARSKKYLIMGVFLDIAGNLLAAILQLGLILQNVVPYVLLNLLVVMGIIFIVQREYKRGAHDADLP